VVEPGGGGCAEGHAFAGKAANLRRSPVPIEICRCSAANHASESPLVASVVGPEYRPGLGRVSNVERRLGAMLQQ